MSRRSKRNRYHSPWPEYVPVGERRAQAEKHIEKLRKGPVKVEPVVVEGRMIARSFWGKAWCAHLESFSDFANRLPRGRTYARNGLICHLGVSPGRIEAVVSGSRLYQVAVDVAPLPRDAWEALKAQCAGSVGSLLELMQGRLADNVMKAVANSDAGLFPKPGDMQIACSCPDWATMCKHVAGALYGVGARLDSQPELLFLLRDVDPAELVDAQAAFSGGGDEANALDEEALAGIFGVDIDDAPDGKSVRPQAKSAPAAPPPPKPAASHGPRFDPEAPTGKAVAHLRNRTGLNSGEFAKRLGVSGASVSRWEWRPGRLKLRERPLRLLAALQDELDAAAASLSAPPQPVKETKRKKPKSAAPRFNPKAPTGKAVARLRKRMGGSLAEFAGALGVSSAAVARWESIPGRLRLQKRSVRELEALQNRLDQC